MSCPQLSICIPTYNRVGLLRQTLDSILLAVKGNEGKIEIVISDNASIDATCELVNEYQRVHPFITYHRNDKNVAEMNFYIVASLAKGNYIWVFSDDDLMEPYAISIVLNRINENYNLILCNYSLWSNDFSTILRNRMLSVHKDVIIREHDILLRTIGLRLGFISMVIIRRNIFMEFPASKYEAYVEYGFPFVYAVYSGMLNRGQIYIESNPLLKQRGGLINERADKDWWYKCFVGGSSLIFEELRERGYSRSTVYKAKQLVLKDDVMSDLIFRRINGKDVNGLFRLLYLNYKDQWFFWLVCVPILAMPKFSIRMSYGFFLSLSNIFKLIRKGSWFTKKSDI